MVIFYENPFHYFKESLEIGSEETGCGRRLLCRVVFFALEKKNGCKRTWLVMSDIVVVVNIYY